MSRVACLKNPPSVKCVLVGQTMPPKRKPRLPSRATSTPSGDIAEHLAEEIQTPIKQDVAKAAIVSDSWTDEQETSLFKGMIRWKPVGSFRTDQSIPLDFVAWQFTKFKH